MISVIKASYKYTLLCFNVFLAEWVGHLPPSPPQLSPWDPGRVTTQRFSSRSDWTLPCVHEGIVTVKLRHAEVAASSVESRFSAFCLSRSQTCLIHTMDLILTRSGDAAAQMQRIPTDLKGSAGFSRSALVRILMSCTLMENVSAASNCSSPPPCHTKR